MLTSGQWSLNQQLWITLTRTIFRKTYRQVLDESRKNCALDLDSLPCAIIECQDEVEKVAFPEI